MKYLKRLIFFYVFALIFSLFMFYTTYACNVTGCGYTNGERGFYMIFIIFGLFFFLLVDPDKMKRPKTFKDRDKVKHEIAAVTYKALTSPGYDFNRFNKEVWEVIDEAEKTEVWGE